MRRGADSPRARIESAQRDLDAARGRVSRDLAAVRTEFRRHRATWIVAGGLAGGLALGTLPVRVWSRAGAALGRATALVARSVLAPMIAGALLAGERDAMRRDTDQ